MNIQTQAQLDNLTPQQAQDWLIEYDREGAEYWKSIPAELGVGLITAVKDNIRDFGFQTEDGKPLNPKQVYEQNHAERVAKPKFEYLYNDAIYDGVFDIIKLQGEDNFLFSFLDDGGYFNIFKSMQEFYNYVIDEPCERICFEDESYEEDDPRYEEGVDALDRYLRSLP